MKEHVNIYYKDLYIKCTSHLIVEKPQSKMMRLKNYKIILDLKFA